MNTVAISPGVGAGPGHPLLLIAGPCVVESRDFTVKMAETVAEIAARHDVGAIFKASFDKANRSSGESYRGAGMEEGLAALAAARDATGLPVTTDVHETIQAEPVAEVADVLQIPAFLSRQTDLLMACGATGKTVNVKKGQFLSPPEMGNAVAKLEDAGARGIILTERGTTFGYNNLVVDFRSLPQMRDLGWPVCFDATHSVQQPGGLGTASGGERQYVPVLARAAAAVGIDALFVEVHDDPSRAPSDGPNMLTPQGLDELLREVLEIRGQ